VLIGPSLQPATLQPHLFPSLKLMLLLLFSLVLFLLVTPDDFLAGFTDLFQFGFLKALELDFLVEVAAEAPGAWVGW
jgi:hypothetical protein